MPWHENIIIVFVKETQNLMPRPQYNGFYLYTRISKYPLETILIKVHSILWKRKHVIH